MIVMTSSCGGGPSARAGGAPELNLLIWEPSFSRDHCFHGGARDEPRAERRPGRHPVRGGGDDGRPHPHEPVADHFTAGGGGAPMGRGRWP